MDENDLAGLSPEEREALAGDDDERAALEDVVAEAGAAGNEDGAGDDAPAGDDASKGADAKKADATSTDTATEATAEPVDDDDSPFAPAYVPPSTEGLDDQLAALETKRNEVLQQFREGDITVDEMDDQLRALGAERDTLLTKKTTAAVVSDLATQGAQQQWQWEVNRFLRNVKKNEGIDYRAESDMGKKLNSALDMTVKLLANDPDNESRDSEWILEEAHRITKARFNLGAAPNPGARPVADPKAKALADRRPNLKAVPQTLAHVPPAGTDDASTGDSEFAYLDRLTGMEYEVAVAKLTPAQQERWARTG